MNLFRVCLCVCVCVYACDPNGRDAFNRLRVEIKRANATVAKINQTRLNRIFSKSIEIERIITINTENIYFSLENGR